MFAPHPVTTQDIVSYLSEKHGETVGTPELLAAAEHFDCSFATVKKRLKDHKAGIGKWNLTIAEKLEKTYQATAATPAVDQSFFGSL